MFVGNNWEGTATIVDATTFQPLMTINTIPDKEEREQEIRSSPDQLAFFLAIQQFVGEGNHQYTDDMFTNHEGTEVYVSRPSYADVVGIDLATNEIIWRYPMDGYRSDHMAISPDGSRLLVSDSTANIVHEIDPETGEGTGTFASGDSPHENVYIHEGDTVLHASIGRVYTPTDRSELGLVRDTSKGERYFQVVDAGTLEIVHRWDIGEKLDEFGREDMSAAVRPMAPHPDGRTVYFQVSFHHGFVEFDIEEGKVLRVADLPTTEASEGVPREEYLLDSAHHGLALNPAGEKLCAAGTMDDYAAIVDRQSFEANIVSRGTKPYWSTNGPDGKHCWVSYSGDDEVVVIDYASEREIAQVPVGDHPQRVRVGVIDERILAASAGGGAADGGGQAAAPGEEREASSATGLPATGAPAALTLLGLVVLGAAASIRRRH
ncbi:MAG: YncE family protein [Actinobacteria bacterium]|nr:YncE family protein [Actinomycetota bacterium]